MKLFLIIFVILLFLTNSYIADWIYPGNDEDSVSKFWHFRLNVYAILFSLLFIISEMNNGHDNKYVRFFVCIGVGLCVGSAIDRLMGSNGVEWLIDIITTTVTVIFAYRKHIFIKNK